MCAALFGLIAVCSTMALPSRGGGVGWLVVQSIANLRRSSAKFRYPLAAVTFGTPSMPPDASAISCAMSFGALRSRRASSKATGDPRSPSSRVGGYSSAIGGPAPGSMPYSV